MRSGLNVLLCALFGCFLFAGWRVSRGPVTVGPVEGEGISEPFAIVAQEACRALGRGDAGAAREILRSLEESGLGDAEWEQVDSIRRAAERVLWLRILWRILAPAIVALFGLRALLAPDSKGPGLLLCIVAFVWLRAGWTPRAFLARVLEPAPRAKPVVAVEESPSIPPPPRPLLPAEPPAPPSAPPAPAAPAAPKPPPTPTAAKPPAPPPPAAAAPRTSAPAAPAIPPPPAPPAPPASRSPAAPPRPARQMGPKPAERPERIREKVSGLWLRHLPSVRLYVTETEVTVAAWRAVMGRLPAGLPAGEPDANPIRNVTAAEAGEFASLVGGRLLTPQEFATLQTAALGEGLRLRDHAWGGFWGGRTPRAAGTLRAAGGLHDLLGNVAEWVEGRQSMGGSALSSAEELEAGGRRQTFPAFHRSLFIGFRVCRDLR